MLSLNFREDSWPPRTNPRWTPLFARAAAVVTDTGSLMAHASPVAREYGIPAVVGTGDRTMRLRDGMVVTVDGTRGVVEGGRGDGRDELVPLTPGETDSDGSVTRKSGKVRAS